MANVNEVLGTHVEEMSCRELAHELMNTRCALNAQFGAFGEGSDFLGEYEAVLQEEASRRIVMLFGGM